MGSWHEHKLRVRFEETDALAVVYYSKYLVWFEVGRISFLREIGMPYQQWASQGIHTPVVSAHIDYKSSAHFDDEILVRTRVASVGRSSMKFESEVYRMPEMKLLAAGYTIHSMIGKDMKTMHVPEDVRSKLLSS
jgi:acyl-CoA thioester hydrolase